MGALPRVVSVESMGAYLLKIASSDGRVRELDFARTVSFEAFREIADPDVFESVAVDESIGTISWPIGVDLDPDVLHGDVDSGAEFAPRVVRQDQLRPSA